MKMGRANKWAFMAILQTPQELSLHLIKNILVDLKWNKNVLKMVFIQDVMY